MDSTGIITSTIKVIIEALIVTGILGYIFTRRNERLKNSIEEEFNKRDAFFNTQLDIKRRAVEELLGPMIMQFKRSLIALNEYKANDGYREVILKQCNETNRDLLLKKGFLIPFDLQPYAGDLIKHYDGWLQHYHLLREVKSDTQESYVFTYDFPKEAEEKFLAKYEKFRKELKIDERME